MMAGDKFQVDPEHINVTFDDVKGVSSGPVLSVFSAMTSINTA